MRHRSLIRRRLVPSIALAIFIALGTGLLGSITASAVDKPKPPAAASARFTFGVQPATNGKVDKRPNYRYGVTPGGTLRDQVAVRNLSASPVTFRVYATDALNVDNGGFGLLPRAQRPRDVGAWVTVGGLAPDGTVTVPAKSVKVLQLSMKVPAKATPGDHTGGVIVAVTSRSQNSKGTAANVELEQRVAVRLFVRVSGPLHPSLTVNPLDANYQNILNPLGRGATYVTYRITNTGNVNMGGRQSLRVQGLAGPAQVLALPDAAMLLPDGYVDVKTSLKQTWPLVHESATVTIKPLVLPGDRAAGKAIYSAATSFWAVPWSALALLVLIGVGLWFARHTGQGRRRARGTPVHGAGQPFVIGASAGDAGINKRSAGRLVASSSLALAAVIAASGPATAAVVVPYTDSNATGGITLCDKGGHAITSGRVDVPLASAVVAATAAVSPYDGNGRTAGLFAYQPRKGVDPGEWSGMVMTALSRYTNPKHPMVEILPRDYKVRDFVADYPPQWDGLAQLRIYLRVPNQPTKSDTYAATTLKVAGSSWQQVGVSAGAVCTAGTAESVLRLLGLPTAAPSTRPAGTASKGSAGSSSSSRPSASGASSTPTAVSGSADASVAQASAQAKAKLAGSSTGSGGGPLIWVLTVVLLAAAAVGWWSWGRRRQGRLNGS
jgi:hypothetical protein